MAEPTFDIPDKIADESDAERWFNKALKLEKRNDWLAAIAIYDELSRQLAATENGTYAANCADKLRDYIDVGGIPADAPYAGPPPEKLGFRPFGQKTVLVLVIVLFAAVFIYLLGFARDVSPALPLLGLGVSMFWFTFPIVWGRGLSFNGFTFNALPFGDGESPYGDYGIITFLPLRGFKPFLRTIHAKWTLAIPWYCCWFCALTFIGSVTLHAN